MSFPFQVPRTSHEGSPRRGRGKAGHRVLGLLLALGSIPSALAGQASLLTPTGPSLSISNSDDASIPVSIGDVFPNGLRFGSQVYDSIHVSSNGYITLGHPFSGYVPTGIAGYPNGPIIAAQMDDIHPGRGSGEIRFNQIDDQVVVTWQDVEPYSTAIHGSGANTFQIILRRDGSANSQDFTVELRYVALNWITSGNLGDRAFPTAGVSAGDRTIYSEPVQSGTVDFLSLGGGSGLLSWDVVDGELIAPPTVSATTAASSITDSSAISGGTVSSRNGFDITERGIVFSTSPNPTLADSRVAAEEGGLGSFTVEMTGLVPNTSYHLRAYATNEIGTAYGPARSFTTARYPQTITFPGPAPRTYGDAPFDVELSVDTELPLVLTSGDTTVATVSGRTVTIVGAGSVILQAHQEGGETHAPAIQTRTLLVNTRGVTGTFTVEEAREADGGTAAMVLSRGVEGVLESDLGAVDLVGGSATFADAEAGEEKVVTLSGARLEGPRARHYHLASVRPTTGAIHPGPATGFRIEAAEGGPIGVQLPGVPFRIRITAMDPVGNVATGFQGTVELGTSGTFSAGGGRTGPFSGGVLELPVTLSSRGTHTLTAVGDRDSWRGTSAPFVVAPEHGHLVVALEASEERIVYGETVTLRIRVTNVGQSAAVDPVMPNPIADEVRLVVEGFEPMQGVVDPETGSWYPGRIEAGESAILLIHARGVRP